MPLPPLLNRVLLLMVTFCELRRLTPAPLAQMTLLPTLMGPSLASICNPDITLPASVTLLIVPFSLSVSNHSPWARFLYEKWFCTVVLRVNISLVPPIPQSNRAPSAPRQLL